MTTSVSTTIAAIATASGMGGVGVVRASGPLALSIAKQIAKRRLIQPRCAHRAIIRDAQGQPIDDGILLYFQGPASFTGEDVVEFQGHGGVYVLQAVLERFYALGAVPAQPGEFTQRAYMNSKLDLAQAEAVADLIHARSAAAARAAAQSLSGVFSRTVHDLHEQLIALRVWVEALIDFTDEDIDFSFQQEVTEKLALLQRAVAQLLAQAQRGVLLSKGARVVIVGKPNAGKSSLLNRLAQEERAIVTPIPGTTRDTIDVEIQIQGIPVRLTDTAGLRQLSEADEVEQLGMTRAQAVMAAADVVLWVHDVQDSSQDFLQKYPIKQPYLKVLNKMDTLNQPLACSDADILVSVKENIGIDVLQQRLVHLLQGEQASMLNAEQQDSCFSARQRHLNHLQQANEALLHGEMAWQSGALELLAHALRQAHDAMGEILGKMSADELLGKIFGSFCIGK